MMRALAAGERHQAWLFLGALVLGAVVGLALPGFGAAVEASLTPVLGLLLFLTFLTVPLGRLRDAGRDGMEVAWIPS